MALRRLHQGAVQGHDELLATHAQQECLQGLAHVVAGIHGGQIEAVGDFIITALAHAVDLVQLTQLRRAGLVVDVVQEVHRFDGNPLVHAQVLGGKLALEKGVAVLVEQRQARRDNALRAGRHAGAIQPFIEFRWRHHVRMLRQQVLAQVGDELLRRHALERVLVEPAAQERIEHGTAGAAFHGGQEPGALRINDAVIRVRFGRVGVRIARDQRRFRRRQCLDRGGQFFLVDLHAHLRHVAAIQLLDDARGDVGGKAFVEPHVLPRGVGDQVARPRVGQFMRDQVDQAAVARDHGRREEGQARVFHATVGERWRQHDHVVASPAIRPIQRFGGLDHLFRIGQLVFGRLDARRFGIHGGTGTEFAHFQFADGDGQQVRWNRLRHPEFPATLARRLVVILGAHHDAHARWRIDARAVGKTHGRRVLRWHPRAGIDALRLAEHERQLARHGLLRREPLQRNGVRRGVIVDAHLARLARGGDAQRLAFFRVGLVQLVRRHLPCAALVLYLHFRDRQIARIEHQGTRRRVDPVQGQLGIAGERLLLEIGFQVQLQVARAHLVVTRVAEGIGVRCQGHLAK